MCVCVVFAFFFVCLMVYDFVRVCFSVLMCVGFVCGGVVYMSVVCVCLCVCGVLRLFVCVCEVCV